MKYKFSWGNQIYSNKEKQFLLRKSIFLEFPIKYKFLPREYQYTNVFDAIPEVAAGGSAGVPPPPPRPGLHQKHWYIGIPLVKIGILLEILKKIGFP